MVISWAWTWTSKAILGYWIKGGEKQKNKHWLYKYIKQKKPLDFKLKKPKKKKRFKTNSEKNLKFHKVFEKFKKGNSKNVDVLG
jgi:hypothetical protein